MTDIKRYGASDLSGSYYYVREYGMTNVAYATHVFIDDMGKVTRVGSGFAGELWTQEAIDDLPTLAETTTVHLEPAFEEAEANLKAWRERRKKEKAQEPPPPPKHPPLSEGARRFLEDAD